jgi:hypothetical protein
MCYTFLRSILLNLILSVAGRKLGRNNFLSWTGGCAFKLSFYFLATLKTISKKLRRRRGGGCLLILNNQSRVTDGEGGLGVRPKIPLPICSCKASDLDGFFFVSNISIGYDY